MADEHRASHGHVQSYASGEPMPAQADSTNKIFTPANVVTLVRICLVPVFVVALLTPWPEWMGAGPTVAAWKPWIAAVIFVLISCTDWLDGYLARSRNEVTDFGKFMDPLADKILVVAALLALVELGSLPSWPVLIIVAREFIVSGVRMMAATKGEVIAASWYGKFKTVFQMIAIVLFVVKDSTAVIASLTPALERALYIFSWGVMAIALALTIVSMLDYIWKARHLIGLTSKDDSGADEPAAEASDVEAAAEAGIDVDAAARLIRAASERGMCVGTAESCTGGLVAATLTEVPGASAVVRGGVVSYVNEIKQVCLGVDAGVLDEQGAVCEAVAEQMAAGAKAALGVDVAVSLTGIAGPGGAEPGKPVGTVWIGVADEHGARASVHYFAGDRDAVRAQATNVAVQLLIEAVEGSSVISSVSTSA